MTAQTPAERAAAYRARKGARVGQGRGPRPTAQCPSLGAYKRHRRKHEDPCDGCKAVWAEWQRDYQHGRGVS